MDARKGKRFASYTVDEIESFIKHNPDKFNTKRGWELIAGCVLARCSEKIERELPKVQYMAKGTFAGSDQIPRPSLEELFKRDFIEDQDVDIFLQYMT